MIAGFASFAAMLIAASVASGATGTRAVPPSSPSDPSNAPTPPAADVTRPIRVIGLNIRYDNRQDGENSWRFRSSRVISFLSDSDADIIGLQEVLPAQRRDLVAGLPGWGSVGRTREASSAEGESNPLFFNRQRWALIDSRTGTFWLSETPSVPGSRSWKSSLPRIATWAVLRELASGRRILVVNTHLDHASQEARERGARVIAEFLASEADDLPVIVIGDFNAGPSNPARVTLCEGVDASPTLRDAYSTARGGDERAAGTYHAFRGTADGVRIDAILVSEHFEIVNAAIVHTPPQTEHLSDHFPVSAALRLLPDQADAARSRTPPGRPFAAPSASPSQPTPPLEGQSPSPPTHPSSHDAPHPAPSPQPGER